jgi:hypothetical protein
VAKFYFARAKGLGGFVGIHFPFFGYVQNLGSRNTRGDPESTLNETRLFTVSEFLTGINEDAFLELRKLDNHNPPMEFGEHIAETLFEKDTFDRPELQRFLAIEGHKTLVIQSYSNLMKSRSDALDNFCRACFLEFWPIIDLDDAHFPITPSIMKNAKNFPYYVMQNQDKVRDRIMARMAQYHIPREFGRFDK